MKSIILYIILAILFISCSIDDAVPVGHIESLVLMEEFNIAVNEPSDLSYDIDSNCLWTVSDNSNTIYKLDMEGHILAELPYVGEDLEGIFYDKNTQTLWLAEESPSEIVNISTSGNEISRYPMPLPTGTNSGLEGICFNDSGNICLIKEKNPGVFYRLDSNQQIANEIELDFAEDYSAITYDVYREAFWIVSDENERVYLWNEAFGVTREFNLPFSKPEGVCLLPGNTVFYFVSDSENKLYRMELKEN